MFQLFSRFIPRDWVDIFVFLLGEKKILTRWDFVRDQLSHNFKVKNKFTFDIETDLTLVSTETLAQPCKIIFKCRNANSSIAYGELCPLKSCCH